MKTAEQVQKELNIYLEKTSQHVFVRTLNNKDSFFRLFDTKTKDGKTIWLGVFINDELKADRVSIQINIDGWSDPNAKNGIKHLLFLNQGYKSLRLKKKTQYIVDGIREMVATMEAPSSNNWRILDQFKKDVLEKYLLAQ
jgi:hypothetical protein